MAKISFKTPAKINLGLKIGKKRSDGYHEIRTVYQTISLFDAITIKTTSSSDDSIEVAGIESNDVPTDEKNLVLQAIKSLRDLQVSVPSLKIHLTKNIPVGAGLGGGSSDAAAVLKAVKTIVGEDNLTDDLLFKASEGIGADVPFFLRGGTAIARGRGADLRYINDLSGKVLLVVPPYRVDTASAYNSIGPQNENLTERTDWEKIQEQASILDLTNDFDPYLRSKFDRHQDLLDELSNWTNRTAATGSGSSVFGVFESGEKIQSARESMMDKFSECSIFSVDFLPEDQLPVPEVVSQCQ